MYKSLKFAYKLGVKQERVRIASQLNLIRESLIKEMYWSPSNPNMSQKDFLIQKRRYEKVENLANQKVLEILWNTITQH